ncbi:unnamed protein product [Bemisia tabaci]|uniref:Small ribosomal subunit protein mS39 n=1 Tax=Bemisia tabaci TaxID=7038 RepID=A0A9P0F6E0_BEMTA|nr:unnamed protein product [Bemisia tabaci]
MIMSVLLQNVRIQVKKYPAFRSISEQKAVNSEVSQKIKIPARIQRGPTDILRTLASTLTPDTTGAHYKYHDDPFLIPPSNYAKRAFALSKESGRKAAQWVRQQHADLFDHKVAEPFIPIFAPKAVYDENSEVNEAVLKTLIQSSSVSDAICVYELMEKKNIAVSDELKQSLLELVCFYNGKDGKSDEYLDEKWYTANQRTIARKTWQDGGFADKLFKSMNQTPEAICTMIQGMTKYYQVNQAMSLYEEVLNKNLPISLETFNGLIRVSSFVREDFALRWQFVREIFDKMKSQEVMPNIQTLNAALATLAAMATMKNCPKIALALITEFKQLGIEPSLASFYHLLQIMFKREGAKPPILNEILDFLETQGNLEARDAEDINFFVAAMNVCTYKLEDLNLAYRLNNVLHTGNNYDLMGDSLKESIYYRNFFYLVCDLESIEEIMNLYETVVPRIYTPEQSVMIKIIRAVDMNGATEYLPQLWSDAKLFEFNRSEDVLTEFTGVIYKNHTNVAPLNEQLGNIAAGLWHEIEIENPGRRKKIMWTGPMIGSILQAFVDAKRVKDAYTVFQKLRRSQQEIFGVPEAQTLRDFLEFVIENKDGNGALIFVNYCHDNDLAETYEFAERLKNSSILKGTQILNLEKILIVAKNLKEKLDKRKNEKVEIRTDEYFNKNE